MCLECFDGIFIKCSSKNYCRRIFDQFQHFKTVDLWHLNVKYDQIRFVLLNCFYSFIAITAYLRYNKVWEILYIFNHDASCQWLIIYYDHFAAHACGILIVVVKIFSFTSVLTRSFLANNKYNLLCTDCKPKPVPCFGVEVSGSKGLVTVITKLFSSFVAFKLISISSTVSYNPNLIAFSIIGCKSNAGNFNSSRASSYSILVASRCPNLTFSISR